MKKRIKILSRLNTCLSICFIMGSICLLFYTFYLIKVSDTQIEDWEVSLREEIIEFPSLNICYESFFSHPEAGHRPLCHTLDPKYPNLKCAAKFVNRRIPSYPINGSNGDPVGIVTNGACLHINLEKHLNFNPKKINKLNENIFLTITTSQNRNYTNSRWDFFLFYPNENRTSIAEYIKWSDENPNKIPPRDLYYGMFGTRIDQRVSFSIPNISVYNYLYVRVRQIKYIQKNRPNFIIYDVQFDNQYTKSLEDQGIFRIDVYFRQFITEQIIELDNYDKIVRIIYRFGGYISVIITIIIGALGIIFTLLSGLFISFKCYNENKTTPEDSAEIKSENESLMSGVNQVQ